MLALIFGLLGYSLLRRGDLLLGGFCMWACGVNCGYVEAIRNTPWSAILIPLALYFAVVVAIIVMVVTS